MPPARQDLHTLPADLPAPMDDGAARHLPGRRLPALSLPSTSGGEARLDALGEGWTVLYCYPRTGRPDDPGPPEWDAIPGARGCTPQACGYRDHFAELRGLGARVLGVSTQTTDYQREMAGRLQLPYDVLSDAEFRLTEALHLPTFEAGGMRLLRRLTLLVRGGVIEACFYPVFPPDADAEHVIAWLREHADPGFRLREATVADIPLIARHRAAMFRDMGRLAAEREAELVGATADYLREALPRGEYLGWVAQTDQSPPETIGGAGVQLRPILPRPDASGEGIELGPEAIVLNVYVDPAWRRHGVGEALMRSLLDTLAHRKIRRIVLHASDQGRRLYERLGFVASNEMRLERP